MWQKDAAANEVNFFVIDLGDARKYTDNPDDVPRMEKSSHTIYGATPFMHHEVYKRLDPEYKTSWPFYYALRHQVVSLFFCTAFYISVCFPEDMDREKHPNKDLILWPEVNDCTKKRTTFLGAMNTETDTIIEKGTKIKIEGMTMLYMTGYDSQFPNSRKFLRTWWDAFQNRIKIMHEESEKRWRLVQGGEKLYGNVNDENVKRLLQKARGDDLCKPLRDELRDALAKSRTSRKREPVVFDPQREATEEELSRIMEQVIPDIVAEVAYSEGPLPADVAAAVQRLAEADDKEDTPQGARPAT